MSIAGITRRARRRTESVRMSDTCTVRPVTGVTTNPDGTTQPAYGEPVYTGRCELKVQSSYPQSPESGEHQWTVSQVLLRLPVAGSGQVATDQMAEIDESFDPVNVGRRFRVRSADRESHQSAVRFLVEEVSA